LVTYTRDGAIDTWKATLTRTGEIRRYAPNFSGNQFTTLQKNVVATATKLRTLAVGGAWAGGAISFYRAMTYGDRAMGAAEMTFWATTMLTPHGWVLGVGKGVADITGVSAWTREAVEPVAQDVLFPSVASRSGIYGIPFGP
jgi:hypothetical protein